MRELKILGVVVAFTLITYWGVEPFAHSQMHPAVEPPEYSFSDVEGIDSQDGDRQNGAALVQANCVACHSIQSEGFEQMMDDKTLAASYGVVPPDLSTAGKIYNDHYLAAFIKDPVKASKLEHVYTDGKVHPMPAYGWMPESDIADMIAYLKDIAPEKMENKQVFQDACQRCHGIKYGDMLEGTMAARTPKADIKAYMGKLPPDLSQHIRSRGESWLHEFINDPQKHLHGTAMPRVGLTQAAETQVIEYMRAVGDSSAEKRAELGPKFLAYFVVFAIFAWLWKAKIWRDLH